MSGRACSNCGRHTKVTGVPCPKRCSDGLRGVPPDWKPREQWTAAHYTAILFDEFVDRYIGNGITATIQGAEKHYPPAIPPGEEGGRTMQRYPVEVWTRDEDGVREHLLEKAPTFMEATSAQNARDKVVLAISKLGAGVDDHEIVICAPLPLETA